MKEMIAWGSHNGFFFQHVPFQFWRIQQILIVENALQADAALKIFVFGCSAKFVIVVIVVRLQKTRHKKSGSENRLAYQYQDLKLEKDSTCTA